MERFQNGKRVRSKSAIYIYWQFSDGKDNEEEEAKLSHAAVAASGNRKHHEEDESQ